MEFRRPSVRRLLGHWAAKERPHCLPFSISDRLTGMISSFPLAVRFILTSFLAPKRVKLGRNDRPLDRHASKMEFRRPSVPRLFGRWAAKERPFACPFQ